MENAERLDLVGPHEIADRLGIPRPTVYSWHIRGQLPIPDYQSAKAVIWQWERVEPAVTALLAKRIVVDAEHAKKIGN